MRILLHSSYYAPELTAIAKYNAEMAVWLAQRGHDVRVVTTAPHFPAWRIHPGYSAWRYEREVIDGIPVWRCPSYIPARPNGLRRLFSILSLTLSSLPVMLRLAAWRPEVVIGVEPPLPIFAAAKIGARLAGARLWLHVQDLEVDAAFELGILRGHTARRVALAVERWLMTGCDRVSTISHRMAERLRAKGVGEDALMLLPNWCNFEPPKAPTGVGYRAELGIGQREFVALYAGNMAAKQGLETVIETARLLAHRTDVCFVLAGEGAARERLVALSADLPRVRFLPIQPAERLQELLAFADVHLLPQRAAAADLVMPSKLTGMLASGRPTVAAAADGTEIAAVIDGRGLRVPPEDPAAMAASIERLLNDRPLSQQLALAARRYAEAELDMQAVLQRLERELLALTKEPRGRRVPRPMQP
jgi:colanic acid biosynthesis glycosyl transferase WcaI